jgi:hypothetical protein
MFLDTNAILNQDFGLTRIHRNKIPTNHAFLLFYIKA